ncbi:hypothetical protein, partial [Pseudoalteromonas sp. GABNS16H]|uniref:hypothetical protein n=1 Tax=Pseudoalteromonas sp. GABNS16H TaxID=3025325 RepID=UPI00235FC7DC
MTTCNRPSYRIRFDAVVCCIAPKEVHGRAVEAIINDLARRYGGASAQFITGGWAVNGNERKTEYDSVTVEPGFKVSLSVLEADSETAFAHLQKAITRAIGAFNLPAQFV